MFTNDDASYQVPSAMVLFVEVKFFTLGGFTGKILETTCDKKQGPIYSL
jgi:hypothetical protein